jgi:hypothetical protein
MRPLNEGRLNELRRILVGKNVLLMDEVFLVEGQGTHRVDMHLRQVKGVDEPCGGMGVVVRSRPLLS